MQNQRSGKARKVTRPTETVKKMEDTQCSEIATKELVDQLASEHVQTPEWAWGQLSQLSSWQGWDELVKMSVQNFKDARGNAASEEHHRMWLKNKFRKNRSRQLTVDVFGRHFPMVQEHRSSAAGRS